MLILTADIYFHFSSKLKLLKWLKKKTDRESFTLWLQIKPWMPIKEHAVSGDGMAVWVTWLTEVKGTAVSKVLTRRVVTHLRHKSYSNNVKLANTTVWNQTVCVSFSFRQYDQNSIFSKFNTDVSSNMGASGPGGMRINLLQAIFMLSFVHFICPLKIFNTVYTYNQRRNP